MPPSNGLAVEAAVEAIRGKPGAAPVAVVREAAVVDPADPTVAIATAWIVPCADLLAGADLPGASCGDAPIHLVSGTLPANSELRGYAVDADAEALAGPMTVEAPFDATAPTHPLLAPGATAPPGSLPDLIIDPSVIEGDVRACDRCSCWPRPTVPARRSSGFGRPSRSPCRPGARRQAPRLSRP